MSLVGSEQINQINEDGYFVLENVFSIAEMEAVAASIEEYEKRANEQLKADGDSGISRANEITFNSHLAENDPAIREFVTRPEWVEITTKLLGPDVDLYWNQSVFKYPEGERVFPWHQDDAYTPVTPAPYLTCWLALNDATLENGCISVLPGSHKDGLRPHEATNLGLVGYSNEAEDQGVLVPVKSGSVAIFWSLTLHKSGPNRSNGMRKAYVIQYAANPLFRADDMMPITCEIPVARNGIAAPKG
jgi:ectoine hydroxylase-related dioxygenase (phytanoyl-CoA dioxygenase family)